MNQLELRQNQNDLQIVALETFSVKTGSSRLHKMTSFENTVKKSENSPILSTTVLAQPMAGTPLEGCNECKKLKLYLDSYA